MTVDLDSLLGHPNAVGGEIGWAGPLDPEACRRLACDGAVTRVLVTRHPSHHPGHGANVDRGPASPDPSGVEGLDAPPVADDPGGKAPPATHDPNAEAHRNPPPHGRPLRGTTDTHHPSRAQPPTPVGPTGWQPGCGPPRPCSPRPWVAPPPNPWRSDGPPGSSNPPNAAPWPSATAAVSSPTASGPWPGAKPTMCATGCMAAPPTWPTWPCCAEPTTGRCMRAAGGSPAAPTAASPPRHRIGDIPPPGDITAPPDRRTGRSSTSTSRTTSRIRRRLRSATPVLQPPTVDHPRGPPTRCAWLGDSAQAGGAAGRSDEGRLHAL